METLQDLKISADFIRRVQDYHPQGETGSFEGVGNGGGMTAKYNLSESSANGVQAVFGSLMRVHQMAYRVTNPARFEMTYSPVLGENGKPVAFRESGYEKTRDASERDSHETILGAGWCMGLRQSLFELDLVIGAEMGINGSDLSPRIFWGADFLVVPTHPFVNTPWGGLGAGVGVKVLHLGGDLIPNAPEGLLGFEWHASVVHGF